MQVLTIARAATATHDGDVETQRVETVAQVQAAAPQLRYGNGRQTWRPQVVAVVWGRAGASGERWTGWRAAWAKVTGPRLRQDFHPAHRPWIAEPLDLDADTDLARMVVAATAPPDGDELPLSMIPPGPS